MEKKKFRDCISVDEYWMALAFFTAAKSPSKYALILTDEKGFIKAAKEEILVNSQKYEHTTYPEVELLLKCPFPISSCSIYFTCTPCYTSLSLLITSGVKKIVYFKTKDLCEESQDLIQLHRFTSVTPFVGNLNWIKDYVDVLEGSGIFVEPSHK